MTPRLSALTARPDPHAFVGAARAWCATQSKASLLWRAPLWAWLVWSGARHLLAADATDFFALLTFGVHELGHVAFGLFGEFIGVAGGSLAQLAAPLIALWMFWRQRDYFALCLGGYWLASSAFNLALYIGDARAQRIELVSLAAAFGGGEPIHDWHYLLEHLGLLRFDTFLAGVCRAQAALILVAALAWGGWVLWQIWKSPTAPDGKLSRP